MPRQPQTRRPLLERIGLTPTRRAALVRGLQEAARKTGNWARYPGDKTAPPRIVRYALVLVLIIITSATYGVVTAQADANLGPHNAHYQVTVDSTITLDVGPLGSLEIDSPLPLFLGARATVGEIPAGLTALDASETLGALQQDLSTYLQFFAAPQETLALVTQLLIEDAIKRALLCAGVMVLIIAAGAWLVGHGRRKELSYRLSRKTWLAATAYVAITALGMTIVVTQARRDVSADPGRTTSVFAGTALEDARITGRLAGVVDTFGAELVGVYEKNENFYAGANSSLRDAFAARQELDQAASTAAAPFLGGAGVAGSGVDGDGAGADGTGGSDGANEGSQGGSGRADSANAPYGAVNEDDLITMLMVSDLHCNVGVAPLITTAAQEVGASIIINGGDSTINGTDIERFCVQAFAKAVPHGATMVQSDGNHDSALTSKQARDAGITVLDGGVVEVGGVRFLGDSDPRETRIGQGSSQKGEENLTEAGQRLAKVACADGANVDILLIHTPAVGVPVMDTGCVPYQLSGHFHKRLGPLYQGQGVRYGNASTAGAVEGKVTIGPLNGTAEMTVLRFDPHSRRIVDLQIISINPQGTATVGARTRFPQPEDGNRVIYDSQETGRTLFSRPQTEEPSAPGSLEPGDNQTDEQNGS